MTRILLLIWWLCFTVFTAAGDSGKITGIQSFDIPLWFKNSFLDIQEDAQEAADKERHLLLFFHLKNCPYCAKMLNDSFTQKNELLIRGNFDSVEINIRGQREVTYQDTVITEKQFARQIGVQYTPTLLFLDGAGVAILTVGGYRSPAALREVLHYVDTKAYLEMPFAKYREQHTQPTYTLRPLPDFADIKDLSTISGPLLVMLEDEGCDDCDWTHDNILNQADVREQIRRLTAVRLNAQADTPIIRPNGQPDTMRGFAKQLNLSYRPGIVFFDDGREIFRITGLLNRYHFREAVRYVAIGHRQKFPTFSAYLRQRRKELLAAGETVDYSIPD